MSDISNEDTMIIPVTAVLAHPLFSCMITNRDSPLPPTDTEENVCVGDSFYTIVSRLSTRLSRH